MPKCEICQLSPGVDTTLLVCSEACLEALHLHRPAVRVDNIRQLVLLNNDYRRVYDTSEQSQSVLMSLLPSEDIPNEMHPWTTQEITIYAGQIEVTINDTTHLLMTSTGGNRIRIHAGFYHLVKVVGTQAAKLHVQYSPPEHPLNLVQARQPDA